MDEHAIETETSPRPLIAWWWPAIKSVLLSVCLISIPVAALLWFADRWQNKYPEFDLLTVAVVSATAALLASLWALIVQRRFWSGPTRQLFLAIQQAQEGELPIDELSEINGGVKPLVKLIQDLLRIQKAQRIKQAELEQEMRGRIANRTDALERKIGSLKQQAMRDALTGLLNRRSMEHELPRLVVARHSTGADACLLMIDVDNFKSLNDTLGHAAGDQLLKEIGQIIRSTIRESDLAFRCGGDEFVIVLRESSTTVAKEISGRLESLVEALTRSLRMAIPPKLSIGACCLSELEQPAAEAWQEIADKRLYDIKSSKKSKSRSTTVPRTKKTA